MADQTREEMDDYLQSPPVKTADLWLTATVDYGRFDVSWSLMTPEFRHAYVATFLDRVQHFPDLRDEVESRGDIERLARNLVIGAPGDRLWRLLSDELGGAWAAEFADWWPDRVVESHPRVADVEHEDVMFADRVQLPQSRDAYAPPVNSITVRVTLAVNGLYQVASFESPS